MSKYDVALIGLGVMGQNLVRNMASRGFRVLAYNRHTAKSKEFIAKHGHENLDYRVDLTGLVADLKKPRKIMLMVPAGEAVDEMIAKLLPLLARGDMLIDAGNSFYKDSQRRTTELWKKGISFVGMGVSGGEEGALLGPSIMPGGTADDWKKLAPLLKKITAKDFDGKPCVAPMGADGAGHYVKMVHNGIEYGVMQMMAEAYDLLRNVYGLPAAGIGAVFARYNRGRLQSFLFEIAAQVLAEKDPFGTGSLVDVILDRAGQKGTGRWTAVDALERGMAIPTITGAVYARSISSLREERLRLHALYGAIAAKRKKPSVSLTRFTRQLENALFAGMLSVYAQGFEQIRAAAAENGWKTDFAEIARIWQGGCIIRAGLLRLVHGAFAGEKGRAAHLLSAPAVRKILQKNLPDWRQIISAGALAGVPLPALGSSLDYFESMTAAASPANFIQALRDCFGAHTYERIDRPGAFHTRWSALT